MSIREARRTGATTLTSRPRRDGRRWTPSELRAADRYFPEGRLDGPSFERRIDGALVAVWGSTYDGRRFTVVPSTPVAVKRGKR